MKIAHIADSHFQKKRLDECERCFDFIIEYLVKEKPDYIFHAGDLFDKNTLINSPEYLASIDAMFSLADIAPVYMVRGNHDPMYSLDVFEKLDTNHPIHYFDEVNTIENDDFILLSIPYQIPSTVGSGDSIGEIHVTGADEIRSRITEFKNSKSENPKLILAHISILDSRFANSERIQEGEILLSVDDLNIPELRGVFLGHIHNSQQDIFKDTRIRYAGAHYRTRFDEVMEPGFYMWDFFVMQPTIKFVNTPARDMIQINLGEEDTKRLIANGEFDFPEGADIKLVLEVPQGMNKIVNTDEIMNLAPEGTNLNVAVKVNPVVEVRSEKMSKGITDQEKLEEWCRISEVDLVSSLKKKLDEVVNHDRGLYV